MKDLMSDQANLTMPARDYRYFKSGDVQSLQIFFAHLKQRRLKKDRNLASIVRLIPRFEALSWIPAQAGSGDLIETCYSKAHEALHSLLVEKFGKSPVMRPKSWLFFEALSGSLEYYYFLTLIQNEGLNFKNPIINKTMKGWILNSRATGRAFESFLERGARNPFNEYREAVHEQYEICLLLLKHYKSSTKDDSYDFRGLCRDLEKRRRWAFLRHKDFSTFVLYVIAYCGPRSGREDSVIVSKCSKILERSRDMVDFLQNFEITS
jgi:hypothetical protein